MAVKGTGVHTLRCPSGTLTRGELFLYELGCIPSSLISLREAWGLQDASKVRCGLLMKRN